MFVFIHVENKAKQQHFSNSSKNPKHARKNKATRLQQKSVSFGCE